MICDIIMHSRTLDRLLSYLSCVIPGSKNNGDLEWGGNSVKFTKKTYIGILLDIRSVAGADYIR